MNGTLEKVKRLEQYLCVRNTVIDPVLDLTITKLLEREADRIYHLRKRLSEQLAEFEQHYALASAEFHTRYEQGDMGDHTDFVEWSATFEMIDNLDKQLIVLKNPVSL